jgi:Ni/Co efflux regulator RcnB
MGAPPVFLVPAYCRFNWASLGLEPPPMGNQWLRRGPDLRPVDTGTGEIIEVIHGLFVRRTAAP